MISVVVMLMLNIVCYSRCLLVIECCWLLLLFAFEVLLIGVECGYVWYVRIVATCCLFYVCCCVWLVGLVVLLCVIDCFSALLVVIGGCGLYVC